MLSQKKLEANRRNLAKRRPLTEEGRERLRAAARRNRPWERSTGPRTDAGKAAASKNALKHGRETAAVREFRARAIRFLLLDKRAIETLAGLHPMSELASIQWDLATESEWLLAALEAGRRIES
jgi:hypothetical protein